MLGETAAAADKTALRKELGLDRPILVQYGAFMFGVRHFVRARIMDA